MKKTYTARLKNLDAIAEDIESFCATNGATDSQTFAINLAIDEIFTNIVSYGYGESDDNFVEIECQKILSNNKNAIKITVSDSARAFNPLEEVANPDTKSELGDREVGGLGVFFLKKCMDEVSYNRTNDCNVLTMLKILDE